MKFRKVLVFMCLIFTLCLGFYGCGEVFKTGPKYSDAVIGNGGLAVMKGEYVYFVNGYKSSEDNYQDNTGNKIFYSSIYRVKATDAFFSVQTLDDGSKQLMYNEGNLSECDENGNLPGAERLVSKVAGFENSKLFIIDDYLYFTTHSNSVSVSSGEKNTKGVDVYRVNLNGKDFKRIHSMPTFEDGQVNFYKNGKDVYGVFYDGKSKLTIYKNNKKFIEKSDVTDLAMPYFNTYSSEIDYSDEQTIFYVENDKLKSLKIGSKEDEEFYTTNIPDLVGVSNKRLFYVQKTGSSNYLKYINFGFTNFDENSTDRIISYQSCTDYLMMNTDEIQIAVKTSVGIEIYKFRENLNPTAVTLSTKTDANLLFVSGETVFYYTNTDSDKAIYMASEHKEETKLTGDKTCVFNGNSVASITGKYVYFYTEFENKEGKSTYLARVDITSGDNGNFETNDVCVRLEKDYIDKEEEETEAE